MTNLHCPSFRTAREHISANRRRLRVACSVPRSHSGAMRLRLARRALVAG